MSDTNGWAEYKKLVLNEITELKQAKKELEKCVDELRIEVERLKSKLWVHIALSSTAAAGCAGIIDFLMK